MRHIDPVKKLRRFFATPKGFRLKRHANQALGIVSILANTSLIFFIYLTGSYAAIVPAELTFVEGIRYIVEWLSFWLNLMIWSFSLITYLVLIGIVVLAIMGNDYSEEEDL